MSKIVIENNTKQKDVLCVCAVQFHIGRQNPEDFFYTICDRSHIRLAGIKCKMKPEKITTYTFVDKEEEQ